jgi:serine/threonine-protein kinase
MTRLETFGGLRLIDGGGTAISAQRRRLALLALLAAAGNRGVSRDKLQAYLWPDGSPEGARHALEQAVYGLRRQLGDGLFDGTNPLSINPTAMRSDVGELAAAAEAGDDDRVVQLYRGPFLDGFFVADAPEFERWVESCRSQFAERYVESLQALARRDEAAGDRTGVLQWRRLLVEADPFAAAPTLGLMRALAAAGDVAGALQRARIHEGLLRQEFDAEPDPAVVTLASELRRLAQPAAGGRPPSTAATERQAASDAGAVPAPQPDARPARRPGQWLAVGLTAAAVAGTVGITQTRARAGASLEPNRVAVVPFRVVGSDSSLGFLSDGMVDLLAARLTGEGGPEAANPRATLAAWRGQNQATGQAAALGLARAVGAGLVLDGQLAALGNKQLSLTGALRALPDGQLRARATATGPSDSLESVIDRFAAALLASAAGERDDRTAALAAAPLPALRAYLSGRSAYRRGQYDRAVAELGRALDLDSTLTLAALELAAAAGLRFKLRPVDQAVADRGWWTEADTAWTRGIEIAWHDRERLSAPDRVYLHALRGIRFPRSTPLAEHLRAWDQVLHVTPDRADAWYRLGTLLLYLGPSIEASEPRARAVAAFERALSLDSTFLSPVVGLVDAAVFARDTATAKRLAMRYLAHDSTGDDAAYVRWRVTSLAGDAAARRRVRDAFPTLGTATLARIQWISQMDGMALDDAGRAVETLLRRAGSPVERTRALGLARWLSLNRGRPGAVGALEGSITGVTGERYWNPLFAVVYALYWGGDTAAAVAAAKSVEGDAGDALTPADLFVLAQWQLVRGDRRGAERAARILRATVAADSNRYAALLGRVELLDALTASTQGTPPQLALLDKLDSIARLGCCEAPHFVNLILARLREQSGDLRGALRAVRRARWFFPPEYLSTALEEEGRLAALVGDTAAAVASYRHLLALRDTADPLVRPEVERLRRTLALMER